jgi:4-amino-4-deoxy-L-arabinose transferase-like glycosyltransferase
MTSPHASVDAAAPTPSPAHAGRKPYRVSLVFVSIFAALVLLHLPLLRLPYYWDEAGYFVPAAHDLLHTGRLIPRSTLSNAHPPLVMAYLALGWKLFGETIVVTRLLMTLVAAATLAGLFCLARRFAGQAVALATVASTALYSVVFTQTTMAHLDMAAAAFTIWGLLLYLPTNARDNNDDATNASAGATNEGDDVTNELDAATGAPAAPRADAATVRYTNPLMRRLSAVALFALAALSKETAILTPLALFGWELLCLVSSRRSKTMRSLCVEPRRGALWPLLLLLSLVPLALWLTYHYLHTGYFFGNPEFFRFNVESTVTPARILFAGAIRLWHVTAYKNLFFLTGAAALAMFLRPLADASVERARISIPVQLVFAVVTLAHVVALSLVGGAVLARYMLPVVPLVILVCVSTLRRRVRRWPLIVALACAAFAFALVVNPPYRYPWEENLAYRDFILLHKDAAQFLSERYPDAKVITSWPASDELRNAHFGYTDKPLMVLTTVEHFSATELAAAAARAPQYDTVLIFSTNNKFRDLHADEAARLLGGQLVYQNQRRGQWIAVIRKASGEQ